MTLIGNWKKDLLTDKYILSDVEITRIENILKCFVKIEKLRLIRFVVQLSRNLKADNTLINADMIFHASIIEEEQKPDTVNMVFNVDKIRVGNVNNPEGIKKEYPVRRDVIINGILFAILKKLVLELTKNSSVESSHKEIIELCPDEMSKLLYENFLREKQGVKVNKQGRKLRKFEKKT